MTFVLTESQLIELLPTNKQAVTWHNILLEELPKFNINTKLRLAGFLAQCSHESLDFSVLVENLNYSTDALLRVFPKYFKTTDDAATYARNPRMIASRVYANRMGNGPEESGDGWTFRGRGLIQVTGKNNYTDASLAIFNDYSAVSTPEIFATPIGAVQSACWFWQTHGCNELADAGDNIALTKRINGGTHGLDDRQARYQKALSIL